MIYLDKSSYFTNMTCFLRIICVFDEDFLVTVSSKGKKVPK